MTENQNKINELNKIFDNENSELNIDYFKTLIVDILGDSNTCQIFFESYYKTALRNAVIIGALDICNLIWDKMQPQASLEEINPKNKEGDSLMHCAAYFGYIDILKSIWKKMGANEQVEDINPKNENGFTPLHFAAQEGKISVVEAILEKIQIMATIDKMNPKTNEGTTPMHCAAARGHLNAIKAIWAKMGPGAGTYCFNSKDNNGWTLLHTAAYYGHSDIINAIWEKMGPNDQIEDFNPRNLYGNTPLHLAAYEGKKLVVELILEKFQPTATIDEMNPENIIGQTPLLNAAATGHLNIIQAIWAKMRQGASTDKLNFKNNDGWTLLHTAAYCGHPDIIQAIWEKMGPNDQIEDINPKNNFGLTPLHAAAMEGEISAVEAILDKIQLIATIDEMNPKSNEGVTPLHFAAKNGHLNVVQAIFSRLEPNATAENLNPKMFDGETPLYIACKYSQVEIINFLLDSDMVEVNNTGPQNLIDLLQPDKPEFNVIRMRLTMLGCLEPNKINVQDIKKIQDVHATSIQTGINQAIDKLKVGKNINQIFKSFDEFVCYCDSNNEAFIQDLSSLEVTPQNFSRELIVRALSIKYGISETKISCIEKLKLTTFQEAIASQIHNCTLSINSTDLVHSFKERVGLIWNELNNPVNWYKFNELNEIMSEEKEWGLSGSLENEKIIVKSKLKLALQNLRNVLFSTLIETRFEYPPDNLEESSIGDYERLMKSSPSCIGGINDRIIESFSFKHRDIIVVNGVFATDFDKNDPLQKKIDSKLYELIIASANYRIDEISGIELIQEILDRMANVSDKVRGIESEKHLLLEEQVRVYFKTGSVPGHSRAIGHYLGFLKQTLLQHLDMIGNIQVQPIDNQEQVLSDIFKHLELALANTPKNFITQSFFDAKKAYYQSLLDENIVDWKLEHLVNIAKNIDSKYCDERLLLKNIILKKYGEITKDKKGKHHHERPKTFMTLTISNAIGNSVWYKNIKIHLQSKLSSEEKNICEYDALMLKINKMLGVKSYVGDSRLVDDLTISEDEEEQEYKANISSKYSDSENDEEKTKKEQKHVIKPLPIFNLSPPHTHTGKIIQRRNSTSNANSSDRVQDGSSDNKRSVHCRGCFIS